MAFLDRIFKPRRPGRRRHEPERDTKPYPALLTLGVTDAISRRVIYKNTPKNLRYFSHTPIARRAINAVKMPLSMLDWEIACKPDIEKNSELQRQIDVVTRCFNNPNDDDNFVSFNQQVCEDILLGAGAIEVELSGWDERPVWMWPVDGLSIQMLPGWAGGRTEARYLQTLGYGGTGQTLGQGVLLRNDELIYLRPNPSTATPFGFGPLEIAFNSISRQLATAEFAGKVAANSLPPFMLDLGEADKDTLKTWRSYWRNEVEGQGVVPIVGTEAVAGNSGKSRGANVIRLYPEGDKALYIQYQEFLRSEIAAAFDISNQNLNIERDVNRSTSEVAEDRDWNGAIKPLAQLLKAHYDREVIEGKLGFTQIEFKWVGLDREDELATQQILCGYFDRSIYTINELRAKLGEEPDTGEWADMRLVDMKIAEQAARSAAIIEDVNLPEQGGAGTDPAGGKTDPEKPDATKPASKASDKKPAPKQTKP